MLPRLRAEMGAILFDSVKLEKQLSEFAGQRRPRVRVQQCAVRYPARVVPLGRGSLQLQFVDSKRVLILDVDDRVVYVGYQGVHVHDVSGRR